METPPSQAQAQSALKPSTDQAQAQPTLSPARGGDSGSHREHVILPGLIGSVWRLAGCKPKFDGHLCRLISCKGTRAKVRLVDDPEAKSYYVSCHHLVAPRDDDEEAKALQPAAGDEQELDSRRASAKSQGSQGFDSRKSSISVSPLGCASPMTGREDDNPDKNDQQSAIAQKGRQFLQLAATGLQQRMHEDPFRQNKSKAQTLGATRLALAAGTWSPRGSPPDSPIATG
jgi:hypothetical protein